MARLTFAEIRARFEAVGHGAAVFEITDPPEFVAGLTLEGLPEYGTPESAALDAVTDGLEAEAGHYELCFTGRETGGR